MNKRDKEIIDLYNSGLSLRNVGKQVGLSHQGVNNVLDKYNINKRVTNFAEKDKRILTLYKNGYSKNRMYSEFNISGKRVDEALERNGLKYTTPIRKAK